MARFVLPLLFVTISAFAQTQTQTQPQTPAAPYPYPYPPTRTEDDRRESRAQVNRSECTRNEDAFNTAKRELQKSRCGSITACINTASECEDEVGDEADDDAPSFPAISGFGNQYSTNDSGHRAIVNTLKNCPIFSKEELDDIKAKKDEYKDKMDDAEERLQELQADASEAAGEMQNLQERMVELQNNFQSDTQEATQDRSEELNQEMQDITTQLKQRLLSIEVKYEEKQARYRAVYAECHAKALENIEKIKERRQGKIAAGKLVTKSLNELGALTSSEDRLQKEAQRLIRSCENDTVTKGKIKAIDRGFELEMKVLENEISSLNSQFNQSVNKLKDSSQDRELQRTLKDLKKKFDEEYRQAKQDRQAKERSLQNAQAQIELYTKRKNEAEQKYRQYLEQEAAAGGRRGGDKSYEDFLGDIQSIQDAARAAYGACNCEESMPIDEYPRGNRCDEFLQADRELPPRRTRAAGAVVNALNADNSQNGQQRTNSTNQQRQDNGQQPVPGGGSGGNL